ncbi:MAG: PA0069 family radical SAM protein [Bacteroidota bacterium]
MIEAIDSEYNCMSQSLKGRGAQKKFHNRFFSQSHEVLDEYLNHCELEGESPLEVKTRYIDIFPKSFVNKVVSPDVGMDYSANPYQGCEHGCVYCYARNTHEYWGYGPGVDFESVILIKKNAPQLLEQKLRSRNWQGETIVFSGNTDCYQPIERQLKITRQCLEIMHRWKHPTGIITKNSLILRDLDLLSEMAKIDTIRVAISINTLTESTRRLLEPRTASIRNRLKAVELLSAQGVPVHVMIAPVIPSLNSHEVLPIIEKVSELGARAVAHTIVRLNGQIADIFKDWVHKSLPDRADRILRQIAECHGGTLNDSEWGKRMRGEGRLAKQIYDLVALGKRKYLKGRSLPPLDPSHYLQLKNPQLNLFTEE